MDDAGGGSRWGGKGDSLPAGDEVVKCAHGLFGGRPVIVAVDLEDVDIAGVQAPQRRLNRRKDGSPRES